MVSVLYVNVIHAHKKNQHELILRERRRNGCRYIVLQKLRKRGLGEV